MKNAYVWWIIGSSPWGQIAYEVMCLRKLKFKKFERKSFSEK